jgi:hypothetical protein
MNQENQVEQILHGVRVRHYGEGQPFFVKSQAAKEHLLSGVATEMLAGGEKGKQARSVAEEFQRCKVIVNSEIFLKKL